MSRSRKRRNHEQPSGHKGRNRRRGAGRSGGQRQAPADFWGDASRLPPRDVVRVTEDPTATVRSLGPPPLPGHEDIAEHYFAVVYDRAVNLAGALATVGGLADSGDQAAGDEAGG